MFASKPSKAYVFFLANQQPQNASSPDMETYPKLMMQQVQSLSLILTREAKELTQAQCDVMLNGESTGILVPGHILEAAVQVNDQRYILFLTDDVIFEESLTIALIDVHDGLKEIVRLGNEYSTGSFADLQITEDSVNFRFIGDYIWTVEVSDSPRLRLPFISDPKGVKRESGLKKYIAISATPLPENIS
ncbi:hypothetical protein [Enterobacter cloacae]|uniref:hypothetical protein n=1 Tax=Enterobacter cloacae TaxID=550 RepID=UPI001F4FD0C9|nr:hypothetical protein [Enterobacter cloacae]